jgi:hypothetical protein
MDQIDLGPEPQTVLIDRRLWQIAQILKDAANKSYETGRSNVQLIWDQLDHVADRLCERMDDLAGKVLLRTPSAEFESLHTVHQFFVEGVTRDGQITTDHVYGACLQEAEITSFTDIARIDPDPNTCAKLIYDKMASRPAKQPKYPSYAELKHIAATAHLWRPVPASSRNRSGQRGRSDKNKSRTQRARE